MSATQEKSTFKRYVQVGRVVLLTVGPFAGKLAAIVEIIDHKRALIDGPKTGVPRQAISFNNISLTQIVIPKFPRGARAGVVSKKWEAAGVEDKWNSTAWAKRLAIREKRRQLSDFERFQVMKLKKERRSVISKALAKAKKSA
ncbi:60S ribosomal protein L14 [Neolecta irregularis DAH-3]|uniref:60S ribosomal protein L14 n=1 Tax=Neolecta irregularis (strain DAH-3) TaxID=1198029 RepID=A0A1U7LSC4_NEOID|nr:60S ribosomal protein L14 [Neolecta irregularis DAH-3]|eukprot:OLL25576.1 60S ribosomal protein L14 [Neolecta irregularis DAH-3]